jgi:Flp pilus assembly pilin Flp
MSRSRLRCAICYEFEAHAAMTKTKLVSRSARRFADDWSGATAIEYAILTFIAVAVIVAVNKFGGTVNGMYESVVEAFTK